MADGAQELQFSHRVQHGESYQSLVRDYYHESDPSKVSRIIAQIQTDNPWLRDHNILFPDELVFLRVPFREVEPSISILNDRMEAHKRWQLIDSKHKSIAQLISRFAGPTSNALSVASGELNAIRGVLEAADESIGSIIESYLEFRSGKITKGQYDYFRKMTLEQLQKDSTHLVNNSVFGEGSAKKIFQIDQAEARSITSAISKGEAAGELPLMARQMARLEFATKAVKAGGFILYGASAALSCLQIHEEHDIKKQNEIAVSALSDLILGPVIGDVLGILAISVLGGPLGIFIALSIAGVAAFGTMYALNKGAVKLYDAYGNNFDLIGHIGLIEANCRAHQ